MIWIVRFPSLQNYVHQTNCQTETLTTNLQLHRGRASPRGTAPAPALSFECLPAHPLTAGPVLAPIRPQSRRAAVRPRSTVPAVAERPWAAPGFGTYQRRAVWSSRRQWRQRGLREWSSFCLCSLLYSGTPPNVKVFLLLLHEYRLSNTRTLLNLIRSETSIL